MEREYRYPAFIRDIDALKRKSRDEVSNFKGTIHDECGAEFFPAIVDVEIALDDSDDPEHPVELVMQGLYAQQCICPMQEDFEPVPVKRAQLTEGTMSFIKEKWEEECGEGSSKLLTGKPYLLERPEQILPLPRTNGEILIWNDYTAKLRFGSKKG